MDCPGKCQWLPNPTQSMCLGHSSRLLGGMGCWPQISDFLTIQSGEIILKPNPNSARCDPPGRHKFWRGFPGVQDLPAAAGGMAALSGRCDGWGAFRLSRNAAGGNRDLCTIRRLLPPLLKRIATGRVRRGGPTKPMGT